VVGIYSSGIVGDFYDNVGRRQRSEVPLAVLHLNNTTQSGYFRVPERYFEMNNHSDNNLHLFVKKKLDGTPLDAEVGIHVLIRRIS
jgi:hypothetical protein